MVKDNYLNSLSVNLPNKEDIRKLVKTIRKLTPSPYSIDYDTGKNGSVLYIYVLLHGRVFCRLDFDLREGLNYGLCLWAVRKAISGELIEEYGWGLPYPVHTIRNRKEVKV